ncbi:hypothetical protein P22_0519 [Propionispora sp. 2/2-37]|uniref:glycosyltransferase n=1 Tax=Propionispora sp. 2/2-37 TaxID=1677858 RepID=UPI0006BB6F4A|nr:hypothetical protein [Propionispora sp. 2/2-37]CUH94453.1 hypothetical protein P22_0519 [Propionispora sp. 2/2-37]
MFLSYSVSVVLISLAIYGSWCFLQDLWLWLKKPRRMQNFGVSFLLVVRNREQEIEDMLRDLVRELELADFECDVVVLDRNSGDLTSRMLNRMVGEYPLLRVVHAPDSVLSIAEALPLCRGEVVHILDVGNRLTVKGYYDVLRLLLNRYEGLGERQQDRN